MHPNGRHSYGNISETCYTLWFPVIFEARGHRGCLHIHSLTRFILSSGATERRPCVTALERNEIVVGGIDENVVYIKDFVNILQI
jgi:hypothetical protein